MISYCRKVCRKVHNDYTQNNRCVFKIILGTKRKVQIGYGSSMKTL